MWPEALKTKYGIRVKRPIAYFELLFPWAFLLNKILPSTKESFEQGRRSGNAPSLGEFLRFLGIILHMSLYPRRGAKNDYWSTESTDDSVISTPTSVMKALRDQTRQPGEYGKRFRMSRDRWQNILRNFRLDSYRDEDLVEVSIYSGCL
jgi:hypothetical protein